MKKRTVYQMPDEDFKKTGNIAEACARYSLGYDTMRKTAEDANAIIRVGRLLLINFTKVDRYMDAISQ